LSVVDLGGVRTGPGSRALSATEGSATVTVVGDCPVGEEELHRVLVAVWAGRWEDLTGWPGSYWVIAGNERERFVCGDLAGLRPIYGSSVTGDASMYACRCGRTFEAAPMAEPPIRPAAAAAGLPRARAGKARSNSGTKPARAATVKAKFPGRCRCGRSYEPGETISKNPDGWGHLDCVASTTGR
jgi:hypothetical protein